MNPIYWVICLLPLFFAILETQKVCINSFWKILFILSLVIVTGFRYDAGTDFFNYTYIYNNYILSVGVVEPLFLGLCALLNALGFGPQMLFLVCAIITILPIAYIINKKYPEYFFTGFAFYVNSYLLFESWNTVRQAIAMTILFVLYYIVENCIENNNLKHIPWIKLLLLTIVAVLFHKTVALVIPIVFFLLYKRRNKKDITILFFILFGSYIFGQICVSLFDFVQGFMPAEYRDAKYFSQIEKRGVNSGLYQIFLNLTVAGLLVFWNNRKKRYLQYNFSYIHLKLYVFAICIYNAFINWYIGLRFYWYFLLFIVLLMPEVMIHTHKNHRFLVFFVSIIIFVIFTLRSNMSDSYANLSLNWSLF